MTKTNLIVSLSLLSMGCVGPGSFDVEVTDDPSPVTDAASDSLLRLSIVDAPEPLALTAVQVWLSPPGGTTSQMSFTHEDNDSDGMLSPGDTLVVQEPPVNIVGAANIGMSYSVRLLESTGPMRVNVLWEGTWTAL